MTVEIFDCEQGSPEWHKLHLGVPTASNFAAIMAKGEGKMRRKYLLQKVAEIFTGEVEEGFTNAHMERGKEMEAEARRLYAFMHDAEPRRVGFIRNDGIGCSPDALLGDRGGLEIKTKLGHLQLETIFARKLPSEHMAQVQGCLWVAEREWWDFTSYRPRLPLFVIRVMRDDAYIRILADEVSRFRDDMNSLVQKLTAQGAQPFADGERLEELIKDPRPQAQRDVESVLGTTDLLKIATPF